MPSSELIFFLIEKIPIGVRPGWRTAAYNDYDVYCQVFGLRFPYLTPTRFFA
jgi:hypothetical protein